MDSITKIRLDRNAIERLVAEAFDGSVKVKEFYEITEGWYNTIYSILLDNNREVVLKIVPPKKIKVLRYEKDIMKAEVHILRHLKAKTGVPVPTVYYYSESGTGLVSEYFIMEKLSGQAYSKIKAELSPESQKEIEMELGKYNRCINDVIGERFGYYSQPDKTADTWFEAFHILVKDILKDGEEYHVKLPEDYEKIEALFIKNASAFDSVKEPRLVHWDLHEGNVIIGSDGHIAGIIDCDRAIWADPLIEYYFKDHSNHQNFIQGYGDLFKWDEAAVIRRKLYNIYLHLIMVIESYYRNYSDNHKKWAYEQLENEIKLL